MAGLSRREILQVGAAAAALAAGEGTFTRALAQQTPDRSRTAQLRRDRQRHAAACGRYSWPAYAGLFPRAVGESRRRRGEGPAATHHRQGFSEALRHSGEVGLGLCADRQGFEALAKSYGRIGGLDRLAAVVKRVRAERGDDKVLFLDGGDTWQGSLGANRSKGQDMVDCMALLKPDAMTGHWEFTYGETRVERADQAARFSVSRAQYPRHRMERAGVRADETVRKGRRENRGARPGVSLYAGRQSPLADAEMVVRYPRGRCARQRREGAQGGCPARRAAVAQRF